MAVKFQYNKVSMQGLQKELKVRINALPTLKSKEAYLRVTIERQKHLLKGLERELETMREEIGGSERLWAEFPESLIEIGAITLGRDNVAGIKVPALGEMRYTVAPVSSFLSPAWLPWGIDTVERLQRKVIEIAVAHERISKLEYARKRTTQKVNLYEKVQIPEFSQAILKIKRYLEDVENLDKAAQKITKSRQAEEAAVW